MGANSFSSAGEPRCAGRHEIRALRQELVVLAGHRGGVNRSLGLWSGLVTEPQLLGLSIPRRFKDFPSSGCGVSRDRASGEPRHTWDPLGGGTFPQPPRPVSRWLRVGTTPACPSAVSASAPLGSRCGSTALAMPAAASLSRSARWTCGRRADWSRLKRFGTAAMRCDGFSAVAPSGRFLRSASLFN